MALLTQRPDPGGPPIGDVRDARRQTDATIARLGMLVGGFTLPLAFGMPASTPLLLLWLPVTLAHLRRWEGARLVVVLAVTAMAAGLILGFELAEPDRVFNGQGAISTLNLFVNALLVLVFALWARSVLSPGQIAFWFGSSALVLGVLMIPTSDNPWKFDLAWPVALVLLGLCERWASRWQTCGTLGLLAAFSAVNDYRSFTGFCLGAAGLTLWQSRPRDPRYKAVRVLATLALIGGVAVAGYSVATTLLLRGDLGEASQARTQTQIDQSGNLLVGGRPEWFGTHQLMLEHPQGFGFGVRANAEDVARTKDGIAQLNIPSSDGYVENYMLGLGFRLHSNIADLWATQSIPGLALGLVLLVTVVRALVLMMVERKVTPLAAFLALVTLWDLGFSPTFSTYHHVLLSIALLARPRRAHVSPTADVDRLAAGNRTDT